MINGGSGIRRSSTRMRAYFDHNVKRVTFRPGSDSGTGMDLTTLAPIIKKARCLEALEIDAATAPSPNFNLVSIFTLPTSNNGAPLGPSLRSLKVKKNYQLLRQAKEIGQYCPNLREIDLGAKSSYHMRVGTDHMDVIMRGCLSLEKIKVTAGRFTRLYDPTLLCTLAPLQNLTLLDIGESSIEDISPLSSSTKLKTLNLGKCRELRSVAALASCLDLESLDLHQVQLLDIAPLALLTKLSHLNLEKARVSSNDLSPLQPLLQLQELNINGLYPPPTTTLACVTGSECLKILNLGHLSMIIATLFLPASCPEGCLSRLQELDLSFGDSRDLSSITSLDLLSLKKFKMTSNPYIERLAGPCHWPSLVVVDLSDCKVLADISAFTNCLQIEEVDLSGTNVSSLAPLAGCQLRVLNLSCCYSLSDSLEMLDGSKLSVVRMRRCYYTQSISFLAKAHNLQELNIGDTAVKDLSPLEGSSLRVLYANNCRISDLRPLGGLSSLETLDLSECNCLTSIEPLGSDALAASLSELYLRNCYSLVDISPLARCLALTFLDIGHIKLSDHGLQVLKGLQKRNIVTITYPNQKKGRSEMLVTFVLDCARGFKSLFQRRL